MSEVKTYTTQNGHFYRITDKNTGKLISIGKLADSNEITTIHNVEFISEEQYEAERPKPEPLSDSATILP